MNIRTIKWIGIAIGVGSLVVFVIILTILSETRIKATNTGIQITKAKLQKESKVSAQEKLYKDDGSGMMTLYGVNSEAVTRGYVRWKKDYPERDKKTVAAAISGGGVAAPYFFVLIYKTE